MKENISGRYIAILPLTAVGILGVLIGLLLSLSAQHVVEHGEMLSLLVNQRFLEAAGRIVATIVLAAVAIFESIGPLSARLAEIGGGETRPDVPSESLALN